MESRTEPEPLLQMQDISKAFPGVVALDGAQLTVRRGEVHALVGQNGAGKSTLMKILPGAYRKDSGSILFDGQPVEFRTPHQAQASGVSTIYQEINLVPYRSVAENIFMGREPRRFGFIDWRAMNRLSATLMFGNRLSSWWMITMPRSAASRGERSITGAPSSPRPPVRGGLMPARVFISVESAATVSPNTVATRPRATAE